MERKLTAILCADVFGYSRLMGENEEATLRTLSSYRKLIDSLIEQHRGRFVNSAGDSVLAEFTSVVNAVQCAVEIQTTLKAENASLSSDRRMEFRIGVNLGDVMVDGEQIYGDGVNVAARLESLADPGSICISGSVHEQLGNKLPLGYQDLGEQTVKNIAKPVRVFRVLPEGASKPTRTSRGTRRKLARHAVFSVAGLALIASVIVFVQHLSLRPPIITASIPPQQKPALPLPNIPSIAVLPFDNMSGDPSQEYFSDGLTDQLITELSRLPGLFVIDRNSSATYKGKAVRANAVSRELGVKYLVEGSVRRSSDRVRITVQLVDATSGADVWAQGYDRPLKDIFAVQDEIVQKITATIGLQVKLAEQGFQIKGPRTDNIEAYDCLLRALELQYLTSKERNAEARQLAEKAISLDPGYPGGYVSLGFSLLFEAIFQWTHDPDVLNRVSQLAQKALSLDPEEAYAYVLSSQVDLRRRQYDQARADAEKAIALAPSDNMAYFWYADILLALGETSEAMAALQKAMRFNPANTDVYGIELGRAYLQMGRYAEARESLKRYSAHYPNEPWPHVYLAVAEMELGREHQAREEATEVLRLSPQFRLFPPEFLKYLPPHVDPVRAKRQYADLVKAGLR